ncbi:MAG TPA: hypothetical protein VGO47_11350 [Chlamydiales bacterium]|nr:hypothetical protein [Chlamydiales bacterium]
MQARPKFVEEVVAISLAAGLITPFLYGIFVILFIISTYFLILRRKSTVNHRISFRTFLVPTICFNVLMFLTVTAVLQASSNIHLLLKLISTFRVASSSAPESLEPF